MNPDAQAAILESWLNYYGIHGAEAEQNALQIITWIYSGEVEQANALINNSPHREQYQKALKFYSKALLGQLGAYEA